MRVHSYVPLKTVRCSKRVPFQPGARGVAMSRPRERHARALAAQPCSIWGLIRRGLLWAQKSCACAGACGVLHGPSALRFD